MPDWSRIGRLLDFCVAYYTIRLVRCAAFSFLLPGLVMLLRKMFFSWRTFIRGLLWSSFLFIPFLGKLKLFYENKAVVGMTGRITHGTMTCLWADRIYMAGILIAVVCIFRKLKLPGFLRVGESCLFEKNLEAGVVRIPYEKRMNDWMAALLKIL